MVFNQMYCCVQNLQTNANVLYVLHLGQNHAFEIVQNQSKKKKKINIRSLCIESNIYKTLTSDTHLYCSIFFTQNEVHFIFACQYIVALHVKNLDFLCICRQTTNSSNRWFYVAKILFILFNIGSFQLSIFLLKSIPHGKTPANQAKYKI